MKSRYSIQDDLLVLKAQSGDSQAFRELVDRWQDKLRRHAYHLTGDGEAAWDVVQESWIAIVKGIRRLQDPAAFPKWAYKIASDRSVDWIRKRERQRRLADRLILEQDGVSGGQSDSCSDLREALDRLPGDLRAMLSLRYTEEYSTAEISEILGIPEGTVKSRLYGAREKLRQLMERS